MIRATADNTDMLINAMSAMMEQMGPMTVHHVSTKAPVDKRPLLDRVLKQMRREFFVASPFLLHASVPESMAAAWVVIRETLMCGDAPRGRKEVVASGVSKANECPFCVDAHQAAVNASQTKDAAMATWAEATNRADHPALANPPFDHHAAEYFGTAVAFHYLNRMVSVFLDKKMMPVPNFMDGSANFMARIMMGGMIRRGAQNRPGDSLDLLPDVDRTREWRPAWAAGASHVSDALAGWSAVNEHLARSQLDTTLIDGLANALDAWSGGESFTDSAWMEQWNPSVEPAQAPIAELALMSAMAPYRVTQATVDAAMKAGLSKPQVLLLVAWSAHRAARRAGEWIASAADA